MKIRSATKKDLKACEILGKIPEFAIPSGGYMKAEWLKDYLDPDFYLVLEDKNKIIGYTFGEPLKGGGVIIMHLTIHKNFRNKGFGATLLQEFEKRVKKRGREWILLYGLAFNKDTLDFYKKHGYSKGKSYYEFVKGL